jgi:hypothetical protein
MGEMSKLGWLIEWSIRDMWADSLYFLYMVSGSICKESAHMSGRSSEQSPELGCPAHLDSCYHSRSQKTATPSRADHVCENCVFMLVPDREIAPLVMIFVLIVL